MIAPSAFAFLLLATPPSTLPAQTAAGGDLARSLTLADSLYDERSYAGSAAAYGAALERSAEGTPERERAIRGLALARLGEGRAEEALALFEQTRTLARERGDRAAELRAIQGIGSSEKSLGRHRRAIAAALEAIEIAREIGEPVREAYLWNNVAGAHTFMGDHARAIDAYGRALALAPDDDPYLDRITAGLAAAHKGRAEFARAEELYLRAREINRRTEDRYTAGIIHDGLGGLYALTGRHHEALAEYAAALESTRLTGARAAEGFTLGHMAELHARLGDAAGARASAEAALAIQRETGDRSGEADALALLAELTLAAGEIDAAIALYREALAVARESNLKTRLADAATGLAVALLSAGRAPEALIAADDALAAAHAAGNPDLAARAGHRRADALWVLGRPAEARAQLETAVAGIEGVRAALTADPAKIGFLDERLEIFHALVDLLAETGEPLAALAAAERARARALADLLAGRIEPAGEAGTALARLREAEIEARPESGDADADILALRGVGPLAAAMSALRDVHEDLASLVAAEALTGSEIVGLARSSGSTLVEYLVTADALHVWVVSPEGDVHAHRAPVGRDELRAAVERIRRTLEGAVATGLPPGSEAAAELAALHALVVDPIEAWLPADPEAIVTLVPHDALLLAPFSALPDRAGRPLIERHALSTAPSLTVLAQLSTDAPAPRALEWLALGNPVPPADAGLGRLPWTAEEVELAAKRFPADDRRVLTGSAASEAGLRALAPTARIVHVAAHGAVSDWEPLASAIVLAPGDGHDGWLRASEVFGLALDAELVVLSGCSTGLGKLSGEGLLGLSRAFLYAGADQILVSLWDVSDRATAELMDAFYAARASGRSDPAALREATLSLRDRYPHPFLWAGFTLVGRAP
ncbi:MAG TPA: CHAT domain-containing tetratricopeptide repeat protein [Gemmatimonadota bacterium]|nr:CHAT domain-containing tetratricopeptide repeat protein [Gemmatimonadota bacterium]